MRRSVAIRVTVCSSMARYSDASLMLIVSLGTHRLLSLLGLALLRLLALAHGVLQRLQLDLERLDPVEEMLHRPRERIGQVHLVEIDLALHTLAQSRYVTRPGTPTTTEFSGTSRTTTEPAPIRLPAPMVKPPRIFGACAHGDIVAQGGVTLLPPDAGAAEGHALKKRHVLAHLRPSRR